MYTIYLSSDRHSDCTITILVFTSELSQEAIRARTAVGDVIDYAVNEDKTEKMMYVTGIVGVYILVEIAIYQKLNLHLLISTITRTMLNRQKMAIYQPK